MRRAWLLGAVFLAACQSQAQVSGPSRTSAPIAYSDRFYVEDASGGRIVELDWSGKTVGTVEAAGFGTPSPDGSRYLRTTDQTVVTDWQGRVLAPLPPGLNDYGTAAWADDNRHLCGIAVREGPQAMFWTLLPGQGIKMVGPVTRAASPPIVESCSVSGNEALISAGSMPHWPPGGTRYLVTTEVATINLTTGAIGYHRTYPLGGIGDDPNRWISVIPSPNGRYLGENSIFSGTTSIRDLTSDKVVATFPGRISGFSYDGSIAVVEAPGAKPEARALHWLDETVVWRQAGQAAEVLALRGSADLLVEVGAPDGDTEIYAIRNGVGQRIVKNANAMFPCPCPAGGAG